jgi:glutamyl-Q tRNA(Asp) synthetase
MPACPIFRFAPSPNGRLHLGHAYSALLNFDLARRHGGRFLLRIEDIDVGRSRPDFVAGIFEDLRWLGLSWEQPVRLQSEHFAGYRAAAERLAARELLYPCFASRTEIEAAAPGDATRRDPDGASLYPGLWRGADPAEVARRKTAGEPFAMRLDMTRAERLARPLSVACFAPNDPFTIKLRPAEPTRWGDAVLQRKETPTSYHLSVVVDDALQGVTHVVRGTDLEAATDLHRLLQALLGLPAPAYHHHRLITDEKGRKLAKSLRDTSMAELRRDGASPEDVRRMVGV